MVDLYQDQTVQELDVLYKCSLWNSGEAGSEPLVGREDLMRLVSGRMRQCRLQTNGKPVGSGLVGTNGTLGNSLSIVKSSPVEQSCQVSDLSSK